MRDKHARNALENAIEQMRRQQAEPGAIEGAAGRVWAKLTDAVEAGASPDQVDPGRPAPAYAPAEPATEVLRGCSDFQNLVPAYLSGQLASSRRLLFEDHIAVCVHCRKQLAAARALTGPGAMDEIARRKQQRISQQNNRRAGLSGRRIPKWAIAAVIVLGVGLTQLSTLRNIIWPREVHAMVRTVDGTLFQIAGQTTRSVRVGDNIAKRETIRTAKDSGALIQIQDGSQIEMRERSELSLDSASDGTTIRLHRGSVIVHAAPQRTGHLYLSSGDCMVSVTGTLFSVNRGTKGSRVSVIEGEVQVSQGSKRTLLHPGDQLSTHPSVERVPVEHEIAWSRQVDAHLVLLHALSAAGKEWNRVEGSALRYRSKLLDLCPEDTVVYAAFPNFSEALGKAYEVFQQHINQSEVLREWWQSPSRHSIGKSELEEMITRIRVFGSFLGDEIVLAIERDSQGEFQAPLLFAELRRPAEFAAALQTEMGRLAASRGVSLPLRVVTDRRELETLSKHAALSGGRREGRARDELLIFAGQDFVVTSPSSESLRKALVRHDNPQASGFRKSDFHSRLASAYSDGVAWLFAADLRSLLKEHTSADARLASREPHRKDADTDFLRQIGVADMQQLIIEQKTVSGRSENRAVLSFNQSRQGIAGWLAEPAPMGTLDFVSPDSPLIASFVLKQPVAIVDEIISLVQKSDPKAWHDILEFQSQHGVDIRSDFAAPLGGEFLFALDGPILPSPSWKLVVEVYDPAKLQKTLEWAVTEANRVAAAEGHPAGLSLTREDLGSRAFYKLSCSDSPLEAHYLFWDGYLVAAPSRALLLQTIQYRESGYTIARSPQFRSLLPVDGQINCSALLYHNLVPLAGSVASLLSPGGAGLNSDQAKSLRDLAAQMKPVLICAYGEKDRLVVAGGGDLGLNLSSFAGIESLRRLLPGQNR
ncbi:MAG TPA: FecR domain-containing protein [Acidobacteriota bacterium]|jgi:hypothetical protein